MCAAQDERARAASAAKLAADLNGRVWVGWPFLREAVIHTVSDKSLRVCSRLRGSHRSSGKICW